MKSSGAMPASGHPPNEWAALVRNASELPADVLPFVSGTAEHGDKRETGWRYDRRVPAQYLPVDTAHAEVFDFEEFPDAVFRAPVNGQIGPMPLSFLPMNGRCRALADADDVVFERVGDAPDAADVAVTPP